MKPPRSTVSRTSSKATIDNAFKTSRNYQSGSKVCSDPNGYNTGTNEALKVFLSDNSLTKGAEVNYTVSENGVIYNLIPNQVYRWELASDSNAYGYVKTTNTRRMIKAGDIRNVRDFGGMAVDIDEDGTADGKLKYGKLFRGFHLGTDQTGVNTLTQLGINEELNVTHSDYNDLQLTDYKRVSTNSWTAYAVDEGDLAINYAEARKNVVTAMEDIIAGNNIYFHCTFGTDRAGTVAYVLAGLLGVTEEDRLEDYELSVFAGRIDRSRYYKIKGSNAKRFTYMYGFMPTSTNIYDWFMRGSQNPTADAQLVQNFRAAMIDYN